MLKKSYFKGLWVVLLFLVMAFVWSVFLEQPVLDPLVSINKSTFFWLLVGVFVFYFWMRNPLRREAITQCVLTLSFASIMAIIFSKVFFNAALKNNFPPNLLASRFGWGGDMAEDGMAIQLFLIGFVISAGLIFVGVQVGRARFLCRHS